MEFRVLGPLEVSDDGRPVDLGGPTQRALLAVLLLHVDEVVSVDRLIDELWSDEPPATAVKTLQAHVSRLRRVLDDGRLETRGHGYVLHIRPGELDADRFRGLLEDARGRLAAADPDGAAEALGEALGLWRGAPLAGLSRNAVARPEIARLDELRLAALEERVEADLARGRHTNVVPELEQLVARHPLRERLRGQLMLALYRSGRHAEALSVYQEGRRALAEDLGLEPSEGLRRLERQILEQDDALAPAAPAARPRPAPTRPRRRALIVVGALAVTGLAIAGVAALAVDDGGDGRRASATELGVAVLDRDTGAVAATVPLGTAPSSVAVGEGSVWVLDANDKTISRVDPESRTRARTFSIAETPTDLAVGAGSLWIGTAFRKSGFAGTNFPRSVFRVDPASGAVQARVVLPRRRASAYLQGGGYSEQHIAVTDAAVWVVNPDSTVSRIDPDTNRRVAIVRGVQALNVAAGAGGVWVVEPKGIAEIDPRTNRVARRVEVAAESLTTLVVGTDTVWVADPIGGSVWRVDVAAKPVLRQIPLALGVGWVALSRSGVWAVNSVADVVHLIDPRTNEARVVSRVVAPQHVAVGAGAVWVTALGPPSRGGTAPAAACGPVFGGRGGGAPLRIVSDLPLQGPVEAQTRPMVDAIRLVLERRGFRAGRHRVAYHSCDDATAQAGGTDFFRCFTNAKAYARALDVVGVIGPYFSYCAALEIPIANQAPRGPLAMIGPTTTLTGLTRRYPGMTRGELEKLYPTRVRNFARVAAGDHVTAVAMVKAAQQLGRRRLVVLWDGDDPYSAGFASDMRAAAHRRGIDVVDGAAWRSQARRFDVLARRVAAARPDAVLLAGAAPPHAGALIRGLRARLGDGPALVANDGFAGFDEIIASAGAAGRGMYVANAGFANRSLPTAGRRFLAELRRARGGAAGPDFAAAYAAGATEVLLAAIARSDGTRASVTRELRRARVDDGVLGDIRFDANGDLVEAPVTLYRIAGRHAVADRVVTVRTGELG